MEAVVPVHPDWKIFVLGREKVPLPNCAICRDAGPEHDRELCECLTCHGIYAATADAGKLAEMSARYPGHPWAVRTGEPSGIIVVDAEGHGSPSGVEVLDDLENWTGFALPPTEQVASTPSGGVHRYYRWAPGVRSRNRVLPGVDIKSDGGYVVIPTVNTADRVWLRAGDPSELSEAMLGWLRSARGRAIDGLGGVSGHTPGYDYDRFMRDGGVPTGMRDEFLNEAIFRLRKQGLTRDVLVVRMREIWKTKILQPPDAQWNLPWWNVEYKIERVWRTVRPDPDPTPEQHDWARQIQLMKLGGQADRVALVRQARQIFEGTVGE